MQIPLVHTELRLACLLLTSLAVVGCGGSGSAAPEPVAASSVRALSSDFDTDSDGLADNLEVQVGSDPGRIDRNCDAVDDASELGLVVSAVNATALEPFCAEFTPFAIEGRSREETTMTVTIPGSGIEKVEMGSTYPLLKLDGELIDAPSFELFDDGTHGDSAAGDGIFSRGGIAYNGPVAAVSTLHFGLLSITTANGTETRAIPEALLGLVPADQGFETVTASSRVRYQSDVYNLRDPVALANLRAWMMGSGDIQRVTRSFYRHVDAGVDMLILFPDSAVRSGAEGRHVIAANDVGGIGIVAVDSSLSYGATRGLQSVVGRRFAASGPTLHEVLHRWGLNLPASLGFSQLTDSAHWGIAGVGEGQLGGFDPDTLVDNGDGTYSADRFGAESNEADAAGYAPLELYLMGLLHPSEVPAAVVPVNASNYQCSPDACTFNADGLASVSVDDIVAELGERIPPQGSSQTDFRSAWVVVSERQLSSSELTFFNLQARLFASSSGDGQLLSFEEATGGRATMDTSVEPDVLQMPSADLAIEMTVVAVGSGLEVRVNVSNTGPGRATLVEARLVLAGNTSFSSNTSGFNAGSGLWSVGDLAAGEARSLVVSAASAIDLNAVAIIRGPIEEDPDTSNNGIVVNYDEP